MSLIDCFLDSLHRPISRYIHPFCYIYPVPLFHLPRPSLSIYLYSVYTHTHACKYTHVCACVDTYTCTLRQMGDLFERSPWSLLGSNITRDRPIRGVSIRQTHTRGLYPCYYLVARPYLASSAHLYEHTHTYTPYMLVYMRVG